MLLKKLVILILFPLLILGSCGETKEGRADIRDNKKDETLLFMIRDWQISDVIEVYQKSNHYDDLIAEAEDHSILEKGFKIFIINDTLISLLEGPELSHFEYTFDSNTNTFHLVALNSNRRKSIIVSHMIQSDGTRKVTLDYDGSAIYQFSEIGTPLVDDREHPYYFENNIWREQATSKESLLKLKQRLKNLVKHNLYILKTTVKRNSRMVDFTDSNGLIRIYNGGIGVIDIDFIPNYWKNTFYNRNQWKQAYLIYSQYIRELNYRGARGNGWVETDYNILLALYKHIDLDINSSQAK